MSTDHENYIRVKRGNKKLVLQVINIDWDGPHTAVSTWKTVKTLDTSATLAELDAEAQKILATPRLFGYCSICKKHCLQGHMYSDSHCYCCAEKHLNVVY